MLIKMQTDLERISEFDPGMWDILRNKKIFATGCTGFIGTWFIYSFVYINRKYQLGAELYCLTRNKDKNEKKFPDIKFIEGDIQSFTFPPGFFDFVIHGAIEVPQQGFASSDLVKMSTVGTERVIDFSRKAEVKKILYLSSGAAYGKQPNDLLLLDENYSGSEKTAYGEAKRIGEDLFFNQDIAVTSARIFTVCGPYLTFDTNYAFFNFMEAIILNRNITISSNGKTIRSYLYVGDVVLWLWLLLLKGKNKEIYNVGSSEEISVLALAKKMLSTLGKDNKIEILGKESEFSRYVPSNNKIRDEFHIKELVPLDLGIKKSFEYLKGCYGV